MIEVIKKKYAIDFSRSMKCWRKLILVRCKCILLGKWLIMNVHKYIRWKSTRKRKKKRSQISVEELSSQFFLIVVQSFFFFQFIFYVFIRASMYIFLMFLLLLFLLLMEIMNRKHFNLFIFRNKLYVSYL